MSDVYHHKTVIMINHDNVDLDILLEFLNPVEVKPITGLIVSSVVETDYDIPKYQEGRLRHMDRGDTMWFCVLLIQSSREGKYEDYFSQLNSHILVARTQIVRNFSN